MMPPTEVRAARATAFILSGTLSSIFVDDGGAGYSLPPNVSIVLTSGSGSGAVVTATVANGSVTALTIQNGGSYSSPASGKVIIDLPPNPLQNAIKSNLYATIILPAGSFDMTTVVSNNVTIRGQGMNLTTISGAGQGSVFRVAPGKTVIFENLTIARGSSTNGGGIFNDGGLVTVQNCRITENEATGTAGEGGGIYNRGSAFLIVSNSVISNNTSRRNGGGIANSGLNTAVLPPLAGTVENLPNTLRDFYSDLQDNVRYGINYTTDYFGNLVASPPDFSKIVRNALSSLDAPDFNNLGKIDDKLQEYFGKSQNDSTAPLDRSVGNVIQAKGPATITNAMSDPYGSGVGGGPTGWVDLGAPVLFILNSTISDNTVTTPFSGFGGGIHNDLGLVFVDNSTIENNLADSNLGTFGGGINSIFGAIRIQNSRLNNNTARSKTIFAAGGAVLSFAGYLDVHDSEFRNNQVEAKFLSSGGAIKHTAGAQGSIKGSAITGNKSGGGGGIANDYLAGLTIDRTTFESNSVSGIIGANGGGIRNDLGGELEISNSTFSFNVGSSRVDLQACKLEYSIVSPK